MSSLTLSRRVALASGFLCVVIAALGMFATFRFGSLRQLSAAISSDSVPGLVHAGQIRNLVSESELWALRLLLTPDAAKRGVIHGELRRLSEATDAEFAAYEATIQATADRTAFERLKAARATFHTIRQRYYELIEQDREAAMAYSAAGMRTAYLDYLAAADGLTKYNVGTAEERGTRLDREVSTNVRVIIIAATVAILVGVMSAVLIVVGLNRLLTRVAQSLHEGAEQVASAATQVSSSSQSLASGASEQAATLEETSSTLEEVASMSKRNADSAVQAKALSDEARSAANGGAARVTEMQQAMDAIKASSDEVAKIIKSIDEIAFQTNILALNAAVEAARAGEAGAGFAVVADEVRSLAQRAASSARETAGKIEESVQRSARGVEISRAVAQALADIKVKSERVDGLIAEIATASDEQTRGVAQVNDAVAQMSRITQANASSAEESAAAAEELTAQAESQKASVRDLQRLVFGDGVEASGQSVVPAAAAFARTMSRSGSHPGPRVALNGHAPKADLRVTLPEPSDAFSDEVPELPAGRGSRRFAN